MNLYLEQAPTAKAAAEPSRTYLVRATTRDFVETGRVMCVERGAGLLDDLPTTVEDLIREHEVAAKHGL